MVYHFWLFTRHAPFRFSTCQITAVLRGRLLLRNRCVVCHNPFCTQPNNRKHSQTMLPFRSIWQSCRNVKYSLRLIISMSVYHVHTARAPSLPRTMARNVIEGSNSLNDTSKKRKCLLRRNVVDVRQIFLVDHTAD